VSGAPAASRAGLLAGAAVLAGLAAVPLLVTDQGVLDTLVRILFYAYLAQAWNLLGGYAGQLSLGHAAYLGVGAYTSSLLFVLAGVSPWIGMWVGAAAAAAVALGIGLLGFRFGLRGVYFSLLTLAANEILRVLVLHWDLAGGAVGIFLPFRGDAPGLLQFKSRVPFYYLALVMTAGVTLLVAAIARSPLGWRLMAIREDEDAARAVGVDTLRAKLAAIVLSGALTALGGTFYAQYYLNIHPTVVFATPLSIEILLRAFVGGAGTIVGPLVGAALLTPLGDVLRGMLSRGGLEGLHLVVYGLLLVVTVLFFPRGLAAGLGRRRAKLRPPDGAGRAAA
jgi:branched-chain amino acid transport system permease protein